MRPKFLVPRLNEWVVPRDRVRNRLAALCARHPVVWVVGTAGSGKTTAVVDMVTRTDLGTVAWLTLDESDIAAGRLLTHLEAAVSVVQDRFGRSASEALRRGVPHVEAAALLAEALADLSVTIVLDELEVIGDAPGALTTLGAFLRALPGSARVILISRRNITLRVGSSLGVGGIGRLEENDLSLDIGEATTILEQFHHVEHIDPADAVHATGGWITGVLFEAWRSPEHAHGHGGEADPLSGYLSAEIMADLTATQQWFITATSVLEHVTADAAVSLGLPSAQETMASFRGRFLPLWTSADGSELLCHPRFRQYLRRRLDNHPVLAEDVHRRHALLLLDSGRPADAVEPAFAARDLPLARRAVEDAVPGALARGDVALLASWLGRIDARSVEQSVPMTRGELLIAVDREAWSRGAGISDRLLALNRTEADRGGLEPSLVGVMAACFSHVGRQADAMDVLALARPSTITDAWISGIGLDAAGSDVHYRDRSPDCGEAVDGMLHRFDLMHGRLTLLTDSAPAPWNASRSSRVGALRASGRLHEAEELLADWSEPELSPALNRMRVELLLDLGRNEEAMAVLSESGEVARRSSRYCHQLHLLLSASVALRYRNDVGTARRLLTAVDRDPTSKQHRRVVEQLPLWMGLADLRSHRFDSAQTHLTHSLDYMLRWDRQLYVPFAGVYLAEAAWHAGDESLVDRAADAALAAAEIQGSDHLLLQALREFPLVLSRRLDAESCAPTGWRRLGRGLLSRRRRPQPRTDVGQPVVKIHDLDKRGIELDGREVDPKLSRSTELLAFLTLPRHRDGVPRSAVLHHLFDGSTDDRAQAYLRRAIGGLRNVLGPDCVEVVNGKLRCAMPAVFSDYVEFTDVAAESLLARGPDRLIALDRAISMSGTDYLPGCTADWAAEIRRELDNERESLRAEAAEAAYEAGDLLGADDRVRAVLNNSPYRESSWRLAMRIAGDLGHDDRVLELFRACRDRLAELAAEPSHGTVELLGRLRR